MDIKIFPLGAGQEVGRSCLIITINGYKIMLDCGVHMGYNDERKFPEFQRLLKKFKKSLNNEEKDASNNSNTNDRYNSTNNNTNNVSNNNTYKFVDPKNAKDYTNIVDLLVISHFHLDHCGALPFFTELLGYKGPILCSQPTKAILPVTLEDFRKVMSEYKGQISILRPEQIKNCVAKIQTIEINETRVFNKDIKVTCFYAGHVLGACMFLIDVNGNRVTYTGDCNTIIDRHLSGAYMPKIYPDVLMTETTYGDKVRETKRIREREFLKKIEETLSKGGKVLIPIFALGRAQELCILIDTYWKRTNNKAPIYFIGPMAQKVNFYYKLFQNWMNPAVKNAFTQRNVFDFKFVQQSDKSLMGVEVPMVIFATPGMLHGGFSLNMFKKIAPEAKNCVIIPGYCSPGTVGNRILNGEKKIEIDGENIDVRCEVYYMSFSAHADQKGLLQLINNISPKNLMLIHGDFEAMKKFKETCQSQIPAKIIMPENKENVTFNESPKYEQVSISSDLLRVIETLEKTKNKTKNINVNNIIYNETNNFLGLKKIKMFGKKNNKINNKINILLKNENAFDIFMNIIKTKEQKYYNDYIYLKENNILKHSISKSEEGEMKICFEYQYNPNKLDGNVISQKCLNVINVFQLINKVI
jgi:integrator complex subunit 11